MISGLVCYLSQYIRISLASSVCQYCPVTVGFDGQVFGICLAYFCLDSQVWLEVNGHNWSPRFVPSQGSYLWLQWSKSIGFLRWPKKSYFWTNNFIEIHPQLF